MAAQETVRSLAVVAGLLAWAMAALLLRHSRHRASYAPLILAFVAEGAIQLASGLPPSQGFPWSPGAQRVVETVAPIAFGLIPWSYLLFLGRLDAPVSRALRHPVARRAFLAALVAMPAWAVLGLAFVGLGSEGAWWEPPYFTLNALAFIAACILGVVAGVGALRRAPPGSLERERARAIAWGFGLRDALIVLGLGLQLVANAGLAFLEPFSPAPLALATLVSVPILAHGVLRAQLFDAELRVRIRRGTVAAAFVALYVVAAHGVVAALTPHVGLTLALSVAALLVLILVPLQSAGERLAQRAFPTAEADESQSDALARADARSLGLRIDDTARLGRFRVVRTLGEGGQATTRLCEDLALGRRVAVKTIRPGANLEDALREARALAAVSHPGVVTLHDVVRDGDQLHLVLEHAPGGSLAERLRGGALRPEEWRRAAADLSEALGALHDAGLVHGDVKPSNVLIAADGRAKLADLGIARWQDADATRHDLADAPPSGTLRYLAPEQARGARASAASDQYALAATLVEAWRGRALVEPRPRETASELLARIARGEDVAEALASLPSDVAEALRPALAPAPSQRYAHARDLHAALRRGAVAHSG